MVCHLTRVFTMHFSGSVCGNGYPDIGVSDNHHSLMHNEGGDQPRFHQITSFTMDKLGVMLGTLAGTAEGSGNLFDSMAVIAGTDVTEGKSHSVSKLPVLVAGRAHGRLVHRRCSPDRQPDRVRRVQRRHAARWRSLVRVT